MLRLPRAAVFAGLCVALSVTSHVAMAGRPVPLWVLGVAVAAVLPVAYVLAGRRLGFVPIAVVMLAGQFGLHELFSVTRPASGPSEGGPSAASALWSRLLLCGPPSAGGVRGWSGTSGLAAHLGALGLDPAWAHAAPVAAAPALASSLATRFGMPGMGGMTGSGAAMTSGMALGPWGMGAAHVVVGLAAAWWLHRGERAVFDLARRAAAGAWAPLRLVARCPLVVDGRLRVPVCAPDIARPRRLVRIADVVVRRGPPGFAGV